MHGILHLPWWGYLTATFILTQISVLSVTIFLHRCQSHRALLLHPISSHFFRFWLWMTTGIVTKEFAATHRKHHAKVETDDDPHSPVTKGLFNVLFKGVKLYRKESRNPQTLAMYGEGTPDDWMENHIYTPHSKMGVTMMLIIDLILFGPIGAVIWGIQMIWIPFFAAGVINAIGHYFGYRNFECPDASRNIVPWGLFLGGEELHNNHHTFGTSAKFSVKWYEFDFGWVVIRLMQFLGLATPKRLAPKLTVLPNKKPIDLDTLKTLVSHRFEVLAQYSRSVILPLWHKEYRGAEITSQPILKNIRKMLVRDTQLVNPSSLKQLDSILENHSTLQTAYQYKLKLQAIWAKSTATQKELLSALQNWCMQAELTGITALNDFVQYLKRCNPQRA